MYKRQIVSIHTLRLRGFLRNTYFLLRLDTYHTPVLTDSVSNVNRKSDFKILGYTVGQVPNLPLILVFAAAIMGRATEQGSLINRISDSIFLMSLTVWSYLETFEGVNLLRRAMGVAGFFIVLTRLASEL